MAKACLHNNNIDITHLGFPFHRERKPRLVSNWWNFLSLRTTG